MGHEIFVLLGTLWGLAVFLGIGVLCTFYPNAVQRAEKLGPINLRPPFEFMRRWVAAPEYIIHLRITGIISLIVTALLLHEIVKIATNLVSQR